MAINLRKLKLWQLVLMFGFILSGIYAFGSFTFDFYAGAATAEFGVWGDVGGVGMFFIYVLGYFITLVVILPILIIKRFGVGLLVYLPYAIIGIPVDYYIEWVLNRSLVSPWAAVGWSAFGLLIGLSADLAYRFVPHRFSERRRVVITGVIMGAVNFLLVAIGLRYFYVEPQVGPASFLGLAYYGLPFLLVSSGLGAYTAHAILRGA